MVLVIFNLCPSGGASVGARRGCRGRRAGRLGVSARRWPAWCRRCSTNISIHAAREMFALPARQDRVTRGASETVDDNITAATSPWRGGGQSMTQRGTVESGGAPTDEISPPATTGCCGWRFSPLTSTTRSNGLHPGAPAANRAILDRHADTRACCRLRRLVVAADQPTTWRWSSAPRPPATTSTRPRPSVTGGRQQPRARAGAPATPRCGISAFGDRPSIRRTRVLQSLMI